MRFPILLPHLGKDKFSLDSSGIAGFFGGEEAFAAMNSVHLIPGRRWMGWYNSPGSYFVAKKYGILPDSTFWDGLFPGATITPAKLLELDARSGPRYTGVYSGTQLPATGHLSYLIGRYCESAKVKENELPTEVTSPPSRGGTASAIFDAPAPSTTSGTLMPSATPLSVPEENHRNIVVTVVDFADVDDKNWGRQKSKFQIPEQYFQPISPRGIVGIMATILFSFASSVLAALYGDWFSFSMILYGAFANGITLLVLGTGNLCLELTSPSKDSPPGHGIMWDSKRIIIVLGNERIISTILHSGYSLEYTNDPKYNKIGYCSILLLVQFLLQLFLIPQGILVGQILFLSTLAMSWICNGYLASFDREEMQTALLFKLMTRDPACYKFTSHKWSVAVAFTMAYFNFEDAEPKGILDELIPNNTPSWNLWKDCICVAVKSKGCNPSSLITDPPSSIDSTTPDELRKSLKAQYDKLSTDKDRTFVRTFLKQADYAFKSIDTVKEELEEEKGEKTREAAKTRPRREASIDSMNDKSEV